jgi:hypothetical protein
MDDMVGSHLHEVGVREAANGVAIIGEGEEKGRVGMTVERVTAAVEHEPRVGVEWRRPLRHVAINAKWQVEELFESAAAGGVDLEDVHRVS